MLILGIETSCDETSAAVIRGEKNQIWVISNVVSSQVKLHAKWGGVVPNLASREHVKNILPVLESALREARSEMKQVDLIAVTNGPGLIPALLIGTSAAKTLAYSFQKPLLGIHHIEGHIYANFISDKNKIIRISNQSQDAKNQKLQTKNSIRFPILCLVVSGGHTQLVLMKEHLKYQIIGETQDDAAGEAFDKVARILGLGYPGGPIVSTYAKNYKPKNTSSADRQENYKLTLPRPMMKSKDFNFSFSGLKTAVLYETKKHPKLLKNKEYIQEICHEFQRAVIDVLISKTIRAAQKYKVKTVMLAGGVSANQELRVQLKKLVKENLGNISCILPEIIYSGDNAAMIAAASYFRFQKTKNKKNLRDNWKKLKTSASLELK